MKWTAHPVVDLRIPPLSEEELRTWLARPGGFDAAMAYWEEHEQAIREAQENPLQRGFEFAYWWYVRDLLARKDELYALGGNGPGKTEIGAKLVVETLMAERGRKVLCVAQSEGATRQLQQPTVYKYLPPSARVLNEGMGPRRRNRISNITFSPKGGFTENTFVLPNRSQCWFKTVEQYERDKVSFEGPEYDLVWIDEPAPIALVDTLKYRVMKRRGKFFFTFTAVEGFDAVCADVLTGARMVKTLPINWVWNESSNIQHPTSSEAPTSKEAKAPSPLRSAGALQDAARGKEPTGHPEPRVVIPVLKPDAEQVKNCPRGHMPFIMQPLNPGQGVIFLWTHWNLFLPRYREDPRDERTENRHWPALFKTVKNKSEREVRTRLFGWAEKISGCQFPLFSPDVHVVPHDRVPREGTDYMSADPCVARSYFLLWVRVDQYGRKWIFDESPDDTHGDWADRKSGQMGEGQRYFAGRGTEFYKAHIRWKETEHGQEAAKRKGDPRAFATEAAAKEGGQTLFELFENDGGTPETAPMFFLPARVRQTILLDLEKVNDELAYDPDKPISRDNEPKLLISERCQNLIRSMANWSPDQGSDSPWKDPIDALRYLLDEPLFYLDPNVPEIVGGRGW